MPELTAIPEAGLDDATAAGAEAVMAAAFDRAPHAPAELAARRSEEKLATGVRFNLHLDGRVVANALTFLRRIGTPAGELTVLALAGVSVLPGLQGRGFGRRLVTAALGRVEDGEAPLALFQTEVPGFYTKLGARAVDNRFVDSKAEDPGADPWWNEHRMVWPAACRWPEGQIDLRGGGW